jgi:hypothetical protein
MSGFHLRESPADEPVAEATVPSHDNGVRPE